MKKIISLLAVAAALGGCSDDIQENIDSNENYDPSKIITIAPVTTKGTMINSEASMSTIGVYCSYTGLTDWSTSSTPGKMFNRKLNRNVSGSWVYADGNPEGWNSSNANDRYTFFSYAPFATNNYDATNNPTGNGIVVNGSSSTAGIPTLTYTVPSNCASQPDLMVSLVQKNIRKTSSPVSLSMQHALTSVGFKMIGAGQQVTKITVKGVKSVGTLAIQGDAIAWTNVSGNSDLDVKINTGTILDGTGKQINSTDGYLMMIPQTLGTNAKVVVTLQGGATREASLNTQTWTAGKHVDYVMTITPQGLITISPATIIIPASGELWGTILCNVSCEDITQLWTLSCTDSWLQLSTNITGSGAAQTASGQGTGVVYAHASANTGNTNRTTTITLSGGVVVNVTQLKQIIPGNYTSGGTLPTGVSSYVGAFWKANQTGERIIRINMGATSSNLGQWNASVAWMDGSWNNGDIVLSADATLDANVDFTTVKTPGDAESYPVNSIRSAVSGTVNANGAIYFRIGLKSTFTPSEAKPARYAVILLQYGTPVKEQLLYLRQGHDPDYLMHKNEPGTPLVGRPHAVKFSPYNLTTPLMGNGGPLITDQIQISVPGLGSFTNYPTQAGAFFQWASLDHLLFAFNPSNPLTGITGWPLSFPTTSWTQGAPLPTLSDAQEGCPKLYSLSYGTVTTFRRPNNGSTSSNFTSATSGNSESMQSLWLDPAGSTSNSITNYMYGYYADGFFDRRMPESTTSVPNGGNALAAAWGTKDVAYIGGLFFNPATNASIFFPSTGFRATNASLNGDLYYAGTIGPYWTSSTYDASISWAYFIGSNLPSYSLLSSLGQAAKNVAQPIRCVR